MAQLEKEILTIIGHSGEVFGTENISRENSVNNNHLSVKTTTFPRAFDDNVQIKLKIKRELLQCAIV